MRRLLHEETDARTARQTNADGDGYGKHGIYIYIYKSLYAEKLMSNYFVE